METNTLLMLSLIVLVGGFAVTSYRLTALTRAVILATTRSADILHHDVGAVLALLTERSTEIAEMIRPLANDAQNMLLSTSSIESDVHDTVRVLAGKPVQAVAVIEGLDVLNDLVQLAKNIEQSLMDLAAISGDVRSIKSELEVIAYNTSGES